MLQSRGLVWTTNVDVAVELACAERAITHPVCARAADRAPERLKPLQQAQPGTLVKLHGTANVPTTMAFTDLELMAPPEAADTRHLARLAVGRTVVLYGYAGADADLADLLDEVFAAAGELLWFEPFANVRAEIGRAFRHADRIRFVPDLGPGQPADVAGMTAALLDLAARCGVAVRPELGDALRIVERPPPPPHLDLPAAAGISQARLVERFGAPADHDAALRAARCDDLAARRWRTAPGHAHWTISRSLYDNGIAADIVRAASGHRRLLAGLPQRRLRDYLITRAPALLMQEGDPAQLGAFAHWAIEVRADAAGHPYPHDLYYRAQAHRYDLRPQLARADADAAVAGLASAALTDPERLAGGLLESGCAAIYQARFDDALTRALDLRYRRGRYAIPRWRGWGAWLEAIARCHLRDPEAASEPLESARAWFEADGRPDPLRDVRSAELLALRVRVALGGSPSREDERLLREARADAPTGRRYRDDLDLILADHDIAAGDVDLARRRLAGIARDPSSPVADRLARLGLAEHHRLAGDRGTAGDAFAAIAVDAHARGATWIGTQAATGLALCEDERTVSAWAALQRLLPGDDAPEDPRELALGKPRVLWLLTI